MIELGRKWIAIEAIQVVAPGGPGWTTIWLSSGLQVTVRVSVEDVIEKMKQAYAIQIPPMPAPQ